MKKEELKKVADDVFKRYPKENKVYVTSDGQAFFDESHAKNHARVNRTGKELELEIFSRPNKTGKAPGNAIAPLTAKELIEKLKMATKEETEMILKAEFDLGDAKRKSVVEAANKRLVELE